MLTDIAAVTGRLNRTQPSARGFNRHSLFALASFWAHVAQTLLCSSKLVYSHRLKGALAALILVASPFAGADDGCTVMLCLAGHWRSIPQCVPPVKKALRDMAKGKGFPTCGFSSAPGTGMGNSWASAPGNCPPQYTIAEGDNGYSCRFSGVLRLTVDSRPWANVWWDMAGETSTEYSADAKAQLGAAADPTFDADFSAWKRAQEEAAAAAAEAARGDSSSGGS